MRLAAGCTGTRRGSLSAPPDLLVAIGGWGHASDGKGGKGGEGDGLPPL